MRFTRLKPDDVYYVADNLWARGRKEAETYGIKDNALLVRRFLELSTEYGYTVWFEDKPVAVFGAYLDPEDDKYYTWFLATEEFGNVGVSLTRFLRGFIRDRKAEKPTAVLELWSAVDHPKARKWFEVLGFEYLEPSGKFHLYRYTG